MLSKNKIKFITSLHSKKNRTENQLFIVEGTKLVLELLQSNFICETIVATNQWFEINNMVKFSCEQISCTEDDLKKISTLSTPQQVLAIAQQKKYNATHINYAKGLHIALDTIQDPGNMGTIIRIADWFGIESIVCSEDCADIYNPKVVQATMGAILRVKITIANLPEILTQSKGNNVPILGTFLDGENIYSNKIPKSGIIVMGNEGKGISREISELVTHKLYIPSFNQNSHSESLNVAIATAITCSECCRP